MWCEKRVDMMWTKRRARAAIRGKRRIETRERWKMNRLGECAWVEGKRAMSNDPKSVRGRHCRRPSQGDGIKGCVRGKKFGSCTFFAGGVLHVWMTWTRVHVLALCLQLIRHPGVYNGTRFTLTFLPLCSRFFRFLRTPAENSRHYLRKSHAFKLLPET